MEVLGTVCSGPSSSRGWRRCTSLLRHQLACCVCRAPSSRLPTWELQRSLHHHSSHPLPPNSRTCCTSSSAAAAAGAAAALAFEESEEEEEVGLLCLEAALATA